MCRKVGLRERVKCLQRGRYLARQRSVDGLRTELLVDADLHSIDEVCDAMKVLGRSGQQVTTTIFAEPGRERNKNWRQLFLEPNVVFCAVMRNRGREGEANDDAIEHACIALQKSKNNVSVALLVSDIGYLEVVSQMSRHGKNVTLIICEKNLSVIKRYRSAGVQVVVLKPRASNFTAVRAILHQDGKGRVELTDPHYTRDFIDELELCASFLEDLGYVQGEREYLTHAAAKFWRTNSMGALTVFPQQLAIEAVCRVAGRGSRRWLRHSEDLAMVIPISAKGGNLSREHKAKYGNGLARQVFRGGGPFMLRDSEDMVKEALTSLGFLDHGMNTDLAEAMLVFVNAPENQHALRKNLNALPALQDSVEQVQDKLRYALQSHSAAGRWRVAPKDGAVRLLLYKDGLLADIKAERAKVFCAMAKYAELHHLPKMKTYNGYAFRIIRKLNSTPNTTGTVEFAV